LPDRKLQLQAAFLSAQTSEQLESMKLEFSRKAAEDVCVVAKELAAVQIQVEKVSTARMGLFCILIHVRFLTFF
jgi:hypothetical protein